MGVSSSCLLPLTREEMRKGKGSILISSPHLTSSPTQGEPNANLIFTLQPMRAPAYLLRISEGVTARATQAHAQAEVRAWLGNGRGGRAGAQCGRGAADGRYRQFRGGRWGLGREGVGDVGLPARRRNGIVNRR